MRAGFYQFAPIFGKPEQNLKKITDTLSKSDTDLAVLPELALTGYVFNDKQEVLNLSETVPGRSTEILAELAIKKNMTIVTGFAEKSGTAVYNSALMFTPAGEIKTYRKNHLFHEEKLFFTPGDLGFPVFTVNGVKIGLLVCFDHFFPEAARTLALQGAQVICHPSCLVLTGKAQVTTRSRSMENKIFWILANRFGTEVNGEKSLSFSGCSQITDPDGRIMVQAGDFEEGFFAVDINPALADDKSATPLCSVFKDRRTDIYLL
ncbi:MAG: nitrilase-related carbon-nitrogen hydrolase [Spirochaetia bacterium]|jgi:predicted amidohydrolase|nr:nitrilase-related carbon-nitrogen hydrolase [Spirochaetia bacterium]